MKHPRKPSPGVIVPPVRQITVSTAPGGKCVVLRWVLMYPGHNSPENFVPIASGKRTRPASPQRRKSGKVRARNKK